MAVVAYIRNKSSFEIQETQQPTARVMTDGHSCQLSQRSVVGIGVAKIEVKGAEGPIRMEHRQHRDQGTRRYGFAAWKGMQTFALVDWKQPRGCTGPGFAFTDEDVRWLSRWRIRMWP